MTAVDDYFQSTDDDLTSGYHLGNAASANVLTKLGFAPTYIAAPIQVSTGEPVDTQQMVLTKAKWNAR